MNNSIAILIGAIVIALAILVTAGRYGISGGGQGGALMVNQISGNTYYCSAMGGCIKLLYYFFKMSLSIFLTLLRKREPLNQRD